MEFFKIFHFFEKDFRFRFQRALSHPQTLSFSQVMQENILSKKLSLGLNISTPSRGVTSPSLKGSIVTIHIKGDKSLIENYRPISLLCLSTETMERVIQDELLSRTQEFLNPALHGFLRGKTCTTNLITLFDNIANNLSRDIGTDIIYFDLARAFDTVNHDLLLAKLKTNFKI